jgi:hypothetical protein
MLAIAFVLRNRVQAGWHGGSWLEVIDNAPNTLGTKYGDSPAIDVRDVPFRKVLQDIDDIYHGITEDELTEGALYYAELTKVNCDWFRENILADLDSHPRLSTVGPVTFFG